MSVKFDYNLLYSRLYFDGKERIPATIDYDLHRRNNRDFKWRKTHDGGWIGCYYNIAVVRLHHRDKDSWIIQVRRAFIGEADGLEQSRNAALDTWCFLKSNGVMPMGQDRVTLRPVPRSWSPSLITQPPL